MNWLIKKSEPRSALNNMQEDYEQLCNITSTTPPQLRFYSWRKPAATYGYFLKPSDYFDLGEVQKHGLELARRPTGGGIIFHTHDLAFSVLVSSDHPFYSSNTLEIYQRINQRVLEGINSSSQLSLSLLSDRQCQKQCHTKFCMANPTIYDIIIDERKVGGAAVRKTRSGLLYQASICLDLPNPQLLTAVLIQGSNIFEVMQKTSYLLNADSEVLKSSLVASLTI